MTEGESDAFSLRLKRYADLQPRDITPRGVAICLLCKRDMFSLRSNVNLSLPPGGRWRAKRDGRRKRYVLASFKVISDLQPRDITLCGVVIYSLFKRDMFSLRSNVNLSLFIDVRGAKKREPDTLYEHLTLLFNSISPKCRGEVPSGELS